MRTKDKILYVLNLRLLIIGLIVLMCKNSYAQDDSTNNFRLKKFQLGFEFGQSPTINQSTKLSVQSKIRPYYKLNFSYNIKLNTIKNYLVTSIGIDRESLYYSYSENNSSNFTIDSNSTVVNGYILNSAESIKDIKLFYAILEFGFRHLYELAPNDKTIFSTFIGLAFKPQIGSNINYSIINQRDSVLHNHVYSSKIDKDGYNTGIKFYESAAKFYLLNLTNGILYKSKKYQHYFGIAVSINFYNANSIYLSKSQNIFLKAQYAFSF